MPQLLAAALFCGSTLSIFFTLSCPTSPSSCCRLPPPVTFLDRNTHKTAYFKHEVRSVCMHAGVCVGVCGLSLRVCRRVFVSISVCKYGHWKDKRDENNSRVQSAQTAPTFSVCFTAGLQHLCAYDAAVVLFTYFILKSHAFINTKM